MSRDTIQFQKDLSLPKFIEKYGTEGACQEALFKLRWPEGFRCPECGNAIYCTLEESSAVSEPPVSPPNIADRQDPVREDQIAADDLVSGDYPADPKQDRVAGAGAGPAPWSGVQNRLAGPAQADVGHA